ncbi:putative L-carnitine dehydratase [Streptomyces chrestomyceticus JCM 4735]|uniref:L-carnitine dehydratase n=1 Tax=Streptomyces chrestomyceticus JCM 4735 TaxID=1306181 RepID=A0A7U9PY46_9ACTN|nr:putative L-carnitine dehydratase [Streptomyces chrestomyceticus JCM 4735]
MPQPTAPRTAQEAPAAPTALACTAPKALEGVLVADFSRVLAGPLAAATLADLGADVVKVERPGSGDDTRSWGPPFSADGTAAYFDAANRSKRGLTLDLSDPGDAAAARELARRADVLIENFRPGALARYGLDPAATLAAHPGLVHCSITGFGSGEGARLPGYDFVVQAVGGLMSITGEPGGPPLKAGVALVDVLTAKDATTAVLAALRHRDRTGQGQHVEVNLLSTLLGSLVNQATGHLATGRDPGPMGNRHPSIAPYETLACRDGEPLAVAVGNDRQFRALAQALGAPGLADDERFARNQDRVRHRVELVGELEKRLAAETPAVWTERLTAASVPCGPVNSVGEALSLAERLGLDPVVPVGAGRTPQVRSPLRLSATPVVAPHAPPALDEHGDPLRAWLSGPDDTPLPPLV